MNLRKIIFTIFTVFLVLVSCKDDDDKVEIVPPRDRTEVYAEDLEEIETFLQTHYFNYDEFDFSDPYSPANDNYEIVFGKIEDDPTKTPIMDMLDQENGPLKYKEVQDPVEESLVYRLYYLDIREGQGYELNSIDKVYLNYDGVLSDNESFESTVNPINLELTYLTTGGVVTGLREALLEFKTATNFTENGDGTTTYHNHGIGAAFVPSGLGYFEIYQNNIPNYSPLIFKFYLYDRTLLDHDKDGIPTILEDLDGDENYFNDDTDGDGAPNFFDKDDDGDGIPTKDEIILKTYPEEGMADFLTKEDAQAYFDTNAADDEVFIEIRYNNSEATYTLKTFIAPDSNGNGKPDYLDITYPVQ
ncbi:FKBP-type peptidyl-prolyl cis-trans isomerase [Oceanihabitans sediminis]|uniref:peptidylprolyl isomerase n=1 Tax=Oceanihabitans sediminis TaxID=1812012 RepID=A0A368P1K6_9FLAO|nr:hypothetical protein [Oceanihabitans sediminis]MDX1277432.1 hypothetical protein [Oceanihabitans sediminis]MDX1774229.1 hypothetical protein [Oceanihabitans sediminis]RBP30761.1 hypothetical protein DFR65_10416 [Oceanihabitans sediminis]RCU56732.1 hypothetical protein DU428_10245 [Oceanihabitans sediminis]